MSTNAFQSPEEARLADQFERDGYVVLPVEDADGLLRIQGALAGVAAEVLGVSPPDDPRPFLDGIAEWVSVERLNEFRLAVISGINAKPWLRPTYFNLARTALFDIVGNELAMQRRINLSIQLPDDDSSLLPVHADVWSGDSPFEVVLWTPLVDCFASKSMYILPPEPNRRVQADMSAFKGKSAEDLYRAIEPDVEFLEVRAGNVVLFSQNLLHGNRINRELETRWSMNCRFKSVFSPYADKKLGEFFEPITLRAATRVGLDYELPRGLD